MSIHEDCENQISEADDRIIALQAEIERLTEALKQITTLNAGKDTDIRWICDLALKPKVEINP